MNPFHRRSLLRAALVLVLALGLAGALAAQVDPESRFAAGLMHLREGRPELAIDEFKKAIKLDPRNPYCYKGPGQALAQKQTIGEAAAYLGHADALVGRGRVEEAIGQLEIGAKEAPDNAGLLLSLGQLYFRVGRFKDARTCLEGALKRDPGGPSGRRAGEMLKELPK